MLHEMSCSFTLWV